MHVDLKGFLLLQIFLSVVFILILLCLNTDDESKAVPEIIGYAILMLTAGLCYGVAYREKPFKKYQFLYLLMAVVLTLILVAVDLGLDLWFTKQNNQTEGKNPSAVLIFFICQRFFCECRVHFSRTCCSIHDPSRLQFATDRFSSCHNSDWFFCHYRSSVSDSIAISDMEIARRQS